MAKKLNWLFVTSLLIGLIFPTGRVQAVSTLPPDTLIPPAEANFTGGTQQLIAAPMGLAVDIYSLGLSASRTDLILPGCDLPLEATFYYTPLPDLSQDAPMGRGWSFLNSARIMESAEYVTLGPIQGQLLRLRPGNGGLTSLPSGGYLYQAADRTAYYFDDSTHDQLTKIESPSGSYLLLAYDDQRRLKSLTDKYSRHLDFTYENGRLASVTDPNEQPTRVVRYEYDADGFLIRVIDPLGNTTSYEYEQLGYYSQAILGTMSTTANPRGVLTRITDALGNWVTIGYDDSWTAVRTISTPVSTVLYRHQEVERYHPSFLYMNYTTVSDVRDGVEWVTRYDFNRSGTLHSVTDPEGGTLEYLWDVQGHLIGVQDERGYLTRYTYDSDDRLIQETDPLDRATHYTYDPDSNQVTSVTDPEGNITRFQYDNQGRVIQVTDPLSNTYNYQYDCCHLVSATDPLSNTTTYTYNPYGDLATVQDASGVTTTFLYNARGELVEMQDGWGNRTELDRDGLGRVTAISYPGSGSFGYVYDAVGNLIQQTDPTGHSLLYTYDPLGQPLSVEDVIGKVEYVPDAWGNFSAIVNEKGERDEFSYDGNGRMLSRTDPLGRTTQYDYDGAGNLIRRTDPLSQTTVYTYDEANQLVGVLYPDGITVTLEYDGMGNLISEANPDVSVSYEYDAAGRLTRKIAAGQTINYTYNAAGRPTSLTDPSGNIIYYSYDGAGRLHTVEDPVAGTTTYHYDAAGNQVQVDHPNGVTTLYTYDADNRITSVIHRTPGGSTLANIAYTLDAAGNRTEMVDETGRTSYTYDDRYRLTQVRYPDGTVTSYSYDSTGNRLTENSTVYTYDAAAQLISAGATTFEMDARGNQIQQATGLLVTDYVYDHENRLVEVQFADGSHVSYAYYPNGQLYSRTDREGNTTQYYYDGTNLLLETGLTGTPLARYTQGVAIDSWLGVERDGSYYTYLRDGLNSVVGLTDAGGALVASYGYDVFGNLRAQTGVIQDPVRYTGRIWDDDAGLYQYRSRWYDPSTGRFLSRDPLGPIAIRQPYAYARNNPATFLDPLGLDTWSCDAGKGSIGFLIGYEYASLRCRNKKTGETCSLTQRCFKLGALAGATFGGCGGYVFNGPANGADLAGGGFSAFGEASAGLGVGVGVEGNISTDDPMADIRDAQSETNLCAGTGYFGAEAGLGGQYCRTSVNQCQRPKEPPTRPPLITPPRRPGDDHADDNYSAASSALQTYPGTTKLLISDPMAERLQQPPAGLSWVDQPRMGVLWHGYAQEAQALLASYGWSSAPVFLDFDPATLNVPVLLIPSGGLYGLEGAPSLRARLESFVAAGGVILAMAQQHGYEFSALPQAIAPDGSTEPLDGYGWTEDNSCFEASLYISEYHPMVAGFDHPILTAGVDGYFSKVPEQASRLLHRTKNGQPALVLYPYLDGWVVATTLYPDWGQAHQQPQEESNRLLRDMVSWAMDPHSPLLEFPSGETVTLPITLTNSSSWDAAGIHLDILDNWGQVHQQSTLEVPVPAGGQASTTLEITGIGSSMTQGFWWVQATLLGAESNVIQPAAWVSRFLISDPPPSVSEDRPFGFSVTAPNEDFLSGPSTFTFHVYNLSDQERTATARYGLPHHTWESGDLSYGDFYNLVHELTVAAHSEYTFTYTPVIFTNDRLFAKLQYENHEQLDWFQVHLITPQVEADFDTFSTSLRRGQVASIPATLSNLQSIATEVMIQFTARDSQNRSLYEWNGTEQVLAGLPTTVPISLTIPVDASLGTGEMQIHVSDNLGKFLDARSAPFEIQESPVGYQTRLPDSLNIGLEQSLWVTATNPSTTGILSTTLAITLTEPSGDSTPLASQQFAVPSGGQVPLFVPFTVPTAQFGEYRLSFRAEDEFLTPQNWDMSLPNQPSIHLDFDRTSYKVRETAGVTVTVDNPGLWNTDPSLRVEMPAAGYVQTDTLNLEAHDWTTVTHSISLPAGLAPGSYPVSATLILPSGLPMQQISPLAIAPGVLSLAPAVVPWTAGQEATVTVSNSGGADVGGVWSLVLKDRQGIPVQSTSGTIDPVLAAGTAEINFSLPGDITSGTYLLQGIITDSLRHHADQRLAWVHVQGVEAALETQTNAPVFLAGDPVTTQVTITNGTLPISGAGLQLSISGLSEEQWIEHHVGDHGPLANNTAVIVLDASGLAWVGYGNSRYLSAWNDGGTPFDKSDDRWAHYLFDHNITDILIDPSGYLWVSLGNYSSGDPTGLVLWDTNGTPFDPSDDRRTSFEAGSGELLFRYVERIAMDAAGRLWFAQRDSGSSPPAVAVSMLDHGGTPFDPVDDQWGSYPSSLFSYRGYITDMAFDSAGRLWVSVEHYLQGGTMVRGLNGTPYDPNDDHAAGYTGTQLPQDIDFDATGRLWIAADEQNYYTHGVYVWDFGASPFDGTGDTTTNFTADNSGLVDDYAVDSLIIDADDYTWVTARGYSSTDPAGLHLLDDNNTPANLSDDTWTVFNMADGLASANAPDITLGAAGWVYLSTNAGVNILDTSGTPWEKADDWWLTVNSGESLVDDRVTDLAVGEDNVIWSLDYGMSTAALLDNNASPADKDDDIWVHMPVKASSLVRESALFTWFGIYDTSSTNFLGVVDTNLTPLETDDDAWSYFSSSSCGLGDVDPLFLRQDEAGNVWLSGDYGICVLDPAGTPLVPGDDQWGNYSSADGLPDDANVPLTIADGNLWTGGGNSGAYLRVTNQTPFIKTDDQAVTFTMGDGLPSNNVQSLDVDTYGNIWIGTSSGVHVRHLSGTPLNKADDVWINFSTSDGLANNWVYTFAFDNAGRVWFATPYGASRLDPGDDLFNRGDDLWESWYTDRRIDDIALDADDNVWLASRNGLIEMTQAILGTLWEHEESVSLSPAQTAALSVPAGTFDVTGKFWLQSELTSGRGQLIGSDLYPFYVVPSEALLTLEASPSLVEAGHTITLTGELYNFSAAPLNNQTLILMQDGITIYSEGPFSLPAGGSHPYYTTTTAPLFGDETRIEASVGSLSVLEIVQIGRPMISASVMPIGLAGEEPISLTVFLTNSGKMTGNVNLTFPEQVVAVAIPPGETILAASSASICGDSSLTIHASGDLSNTWTIPAEFGLELEATLIPEQLYGPGATSIPLALTNSGELDIDYQTVYTITTAPATQDDLHGYLPSGESNIIDLPVVLSIGDYDLAYQVTAGRCSLAGGSAPLSVKPPLALEISGWAQPGPVVTVTATLTNTGSSPFDGMVHLLTDYDYQVSLPTILAVGESQSLNFNLPGELASAGLHTAMLTARTKAPPVEVLAQTQVSWTQSQAEVVLSALPITTILPISQTVTVTFQLENQGDQGGAALMRFSIGDLVDEESNRWLEGGETVEQYFSFFVPPDLEARDYLATYELNGLIGNMIFSVQGISLTVNASTDQPAYQEGEPLTLTLTINNQNAINGQELHVLVAHGELTSTQTLSLADEPMSLTFPLTATFSEGGQVFYGIYHAASERGIYLNTHRLQTRRESVMVLVDGGPFRPGDTVNGMVSGSASGLLEVRAPGFSNALVLDGEEQLLSFTLPERMARGTYAVDYRLTGCECPDEGRQFHALFDVDGPWVRVTEAQIEQQPLSAGDQVILNLTVASDREIDALLGNGLVYPDGKSGLRNSTAWHLDASLNNQITTTATITDTQAGLHLLEYQLVEAADPTLTYASGAEAFDLGSVIVLDVTTDQIDYPTGSEPVTVTVSMLATGTTTEELELKLDGVAHQTLWVDLEMGLQTIDIPLAGPIAPGTRSLTVTMTFDGLYSIASTQFEYGSILPDLVAQPPMLAPPGGSEGTRMLVLRVSNNGLSPSETTSASLYHHPAGGGEFLIDTVTVPALPAGATASISVEWEVVGFGGEQLLSLVVNPIAEYALNNNSSQNVVTLPRLASKLVVEPATIVAGEQTEVQVWLSNLQAFLSLPLTLQVAIYSPTASVVFSQAWNLELEGGAEQWVTTTWSSPTGAISGSYRVEFQVIDSLGGRQSNRAPLLVRKQTLDRFIFLPYVMK